MSCYAQRPSIRTAGSCWLAHGKQRFVVTVATGKRRPSRLLVIEPPRDLKMQATARLRAVSWAAKRSIARYAYFLTLRLLSFAYAGSSNFKVGGKECQWQATGSVGYQTGSSQRECCARCTLVARPLLPPLPLAAASPQTPTAAPRPQLAPGPPSSLRPCAPKRWSGV